MNLLFPETLSEKSYLGTLAVVIPSNALSHPPRHIHFDIPSAWNNTGLSIV